MTIRHYSTHYLPYTRAGETVEVDLKDIRQGLDRFRNASPLADILPEAEGIDIDDNPTVYALNAFGDDVCDVLNEDVILDLYALLKAIEREVSSGAIHYVEEDLKVLDALVEDGLKTAIFIQASGMCDDKDLAEAVIDMCDILDDMIYAFSSDEIAEEEIEDEDL